MKRSTFLRILKTINLVSNNVSTVENFNHKAIVVFKIPAIIGETPIQQKAFRKLIFYASYFKIVPEDNVLVVTAEFDWHS